MSLGLWVYISVILLVGSIYDCKYYKLPVWLLTCGMAGGVAGILYSFFVEGNTLLDVLYCILPGIVSLLLSYITQEQIGQGDGVLLLAIGGCVGLEKTVWIVFAGLLGSFLISVFLIIFQKAKKNRRLAFVPFLFGGTVAVMIRDLFI